MGGFSISDLNPISMAQKSLDFLGKPGGNESTSTNSVVLNAQDQAGKDKVFGAANTAFDNAIATQNRQGYTGPRAVGPSGNTLDAQQQMVGTANGALTDMTGQLQNATQFGLADVLNIANNPVLQAAKQTSNQQMIDQFMQAGGPLAGIRSGAMFGGGFGGSRQGVAEGLALKGLSNSMANSNAQFDNQAYANGLNTFNQTMNSMPQSLSAMLMPAKTLAGVGANQEGYAQQGENYNAAVRDFNVNKDWNQTKNLASILYGGMTPGSTQTGTQTSSPSGLQTLGTLGQMAMMAS